METEYSLKAKLYDIYRWEYPEEAIEIVKNKTGFNNHSVIADFGAGTGKLTKHFNQGAKKVFAIEPDNNMANILMEKKLANTICIKKYSHEITEINHDSIDIIINGHSLHWFDYNKTIDVFRSILKSNGFLVNINNQYAMGNDILDELNYELAKYINKVSEQKKDTNIKKYFENEVCQEWIIPFDQKQTFNILINALSSASFYPDISNGKLYKEFQKDVFKVFNKYEKNEEIILKCNCLVQIGSLNRSIENK